MSYPLPWSLEANDNEGWTDLHFAAFNGHDVSILADEGADLEARELQGWTALMAAAFNGHKGVVSLLLDAGVDAAAKDDEGFTARHWAAFMGHKGLARVLEAAEAAEAASGSVRAEARVLRDAGVARAEVQSAPAQAVAQVLDQAEAGGGGHG